MASWPLVLQVLVLLLLSTKPLLPTTSAFGHIVQTQVACTSPGIYSQLTHRNNNRIKIMMKNAHGPKEQVLPFTSSGLLGTTCTSSTTTTTAVSPMMICVFGRPGAGKTSVAEQALAKLQAQEQDSLETMTDHLKVVIRPIGLDLDVCVPQWMRDNFGKGIYPTLQQRQEFARNACNHVQETLEREQQDLLQRRRQQLEEEEGPTTHAATTTVTMLLCAIVSFSFVNTDLRDFYRQRFPKAHWVLIDTSEFEANWRIQQRTDHFYKGEGDDQTGLETDFDDDKNNNTSLTGQKEQQDATSSTATSTTEEDNHEWKFAPVEFEHMILDGTNTIEENANHVVELVHQIASTTT